MAFEEKFNVGGPSRAALRRAEERNDDARRDDGADVNDIGRVAKFTIHNLPCPAAGPGKRTLTFRDPGRQTRTIYIFPPALYNLLFFGPHK
jgi:hypothetical protein